MKSMVFKCKTYRDGVFKPDTVCISDGIFVSGGSVSISEAVDASSCVLLPGFADVHVHLREPGFSYKETVATGTLAYLTDTDSDVNVMTLGNVEIDQIELERNDEVADDAPLAEGDLSSFQQGQALYPAYVVGDNAYEPQSSMVWGEYVTADNEAVSNLWDDEKLTGALDKFVFVENTGKSPAYVRTVFAFEAPEGVEDKLHFNLNEVEGLEWEELGYIDVQGVNCKLVSAVYSEALAAGEISIPSLLQVALNHTATNEDVAELGDLYSIYVVSQAVQVANMENLTAAEALEKLLLDEL